MTSNFWIDIVARSTRQPDKGVNVGWYANAGLNRESLYKALGETGNPEFSTVMRVMRALGLTLAAHPAERKRTPRKRRAA